MLRKLVVLGILGIAAFFLWEWSQRKPAPTDTLMLYGNVDVREVDLAFRVQGRITSMPFQEGDLVPKDALVATLDPQPYEDQVAQAKADIAVAKSMLENAKILLERRQKLIRDGSVAREDYDNALSKQEVQQATLEKAVATLGVAQTNLDDTKIYSPIDGFMLTRIREPGSVVRPSDPVCTLSIRSPVWVRAYVAEPELGLIRFGMPAEVVTDVGNGKRFVGQVGFISPVATFTPKTVETLDLRTQLVYPLRIITEDPDNLLRQGMPVTVYLKLNSPVPPSEQIDNATL